MIGYYSICVRVKVPLNTRIYLHLVRRLASWNLSSPGLLSTLLSVFRSLGRTDTELTPRDRRATGHRIFPRHAAVVSIPLSSTRSSGDGKAPHSPVFRFLDPASFPVTNESLSDDLIKSRKADHRYLRTTGKERRVSLSTLFFSSFPTTSATTTPLTTAIGSASSTFIGGLVWHHSFPF